MSSLTPCQITRARNLLLANRPPCISIDPVSPGGNDIVIGPGEERTWTFRRDVETNIIIEGGGRLNIHTEVTMAQDKRILVKPGGELYLDCARIRPNDQSTSWQGIIVQGNPAQHQYKLFGQRYQGFVSMQDATVEGAEVAVRLYDPADPLGTSGGVVVATNSRINSDHQPPLP